jgi:CBS domain-containing protein
MRTVAQVMSRDVNPVGPHDSVEQVAQAMLRLDTSLVPVCDGHKLLGVVTHEDIVRRGIAQGKDSRTTYVSDVMNDDASHCFEDQAIDDVLAEIRSKQLRHLPVVDRQRHLVGMISLKETRGTTSALVKTFDENLFLSDSHKMIESPAENFPHKLGYNSDDGY